MMIKSWLKIFPWKPKFITICTMIRSGITNWVETNFAPWFNHWHDSSQKHKDQVFKNILINRHFVRVLSFAALQGMMSFWMSELHFSFFYPTDPLRWPNVALMALSRKSALTLSWEDHVWAAIVNVCLGFWGIDAMSEQPDTDFGRCQINHS